MLQVLIYLTQLLKYFLVLKAEVDKIDIIKLVNVLISLNKLETKVDILVGAKLK